MRRLPRSIFLILALALLPGSLAAESTPAAQSVLQAAIERTAALNAYTCTMKTEIVLGDQKTELDGTVSFLKPGFLMMTSAPAGGKSIAQTRLVSDGKLTHTEIRSEDESVIVLKSLANAGGDASALAGAGQGAMHEMLLQFGQLYDFQLAPEGEGAPIEGQPMDVLIGKYRSGSIGKLLAGAPESSSANAQDYTELLERVMDSLRLSIGKNDRLVHRMELTPAPSSSAGAEVLPKTTTTFLQIQINPALTPDHFRYEPPEGAQIIDTTRPQPAR